MKKRTVSQTSGFNVRRAILLLAVSVGLSVSAYFVFAQSSNPDPWADSVKSTSALVGISDPNNAVGAPDGRYASIVGVGKSITLDMGAGEEGTGPLRVYFGPLLAQASVRVTFLDQNLSDIQHQDIFLVVAVGSSSRNVAYTSSQAYRYVRISGLADVAFSLDAIEAQSYLGSPSTTQTPTSSPPTQTCDSDTWTCGDWNGCSSSGSETRSCVMTTDCPNAATPSPALSRSCTPPPPPPPPSSSTCQYDIWTCSDWDMCSTNGQQTRHCNMYYDCPTAATPSPMLQRSCTSPSGSPSGGTTGTTNNTTNNTTNSTTVNSTSSSNVSNDSTPPTVSKENAEVVDPATAKIAWSTDEPTDGQVEYGPQGGAQQTTPLTGELAKDHIVSLASLKPNTVYAYRILSQDASGNTTQTPEKTFVTEASAPAAMSFDATSVCTKLNIILFILLLIATALAAYWYGKSQQPEKSSKK